MTPQHKPFFNDKGFNSSKITLVEENNIISNKEEIANIMNNYFINVTKTLNLKKQLGVGRSGVNEFENHISIKTIHEKYPEILPESFKFQLLSEVKKEIENLDTKKLSTYGYIPATETGQLLPRIIAPRKLLPCKLSPR